MTAAKTPNEGTPSGVEIAIAQKLQKELAKPNNGLFPFVTVSTESKVKNNTKNLPNIPWPLWNELQNVLKKLNEEYFFEQKNTLVQVENEQESRLTGLKIKEIVLKIERETFK